MTKDNPDTKNIKGDQLFVQGRGYPL